MVPVRGLQCTPDKRCDEACRRFITSPAMYPVESIRLRERKTEGRNGKTLACVLVGGRYDEQGTTRMPVRVGLPKKRMPLGKPVDRLTSAR
jgi:hypothetical protein